MSADLAVHVVWTPVLQADSADAAKHAHHLVPDPRATFYWDANQDLGRSLGRSLPLPRGRQLAWDIYLVYAPDVEWQESAPLPTEWSHQLGEDERFLEDGARLRAAIEGLLPGVK